jgi:hypothetical protein
VDISPGERSHNLRKQVMLDLLDPRVQRLRVIVTVDADWSLGNDRTVVDLLVNEVHGYPRIGHTTFECLVDSVGTRKRWQQCRVHIDDRVREAGHGRW